jgi:phosphate transport system protein
MTESIEHRATRSRFQQGLDSLKAALIEMSQKAQTAVELAVDGYRLRDAHKCQRVFELERWINQDERSIDEAAIDLSAMQQPMAVDLRFITACMKINADLERVGDQAVNIAERALHDFTLPNVPLPIDIDRMGTTVSGMIRRAMESFVDANAQLADAVLEMDDIVDRLNRDCYAAMVRKMKESPECTEQALDALLVARNLERVADHATNIAEDVIFWVRGMDVRHGSWQKDMTESPTR